MTVLITGAAKGLGRAIAKKFLESGWEVIGLDKASFDYSHDGLTVYDVDITDMGRLKQIRADLLDRKVTISVLVNNAGFFKFFPITDSDPVELERIFSVNALAPMQMINIFRDDLVANQGRVIQISSENVKLSGLFQPYPSSKIALESLSTAARQELKLLGVKLIMIRPGAIKTELLEWNHPQSNTYRHYVDRFIRQANSKMSGSIPPEKVADLVHIAATTRKPKKIYNINHNRWLSVFSLLPGSLRDKIVTKMVNS